MKMKSNSLIVKNSFFLAIRTIVITLIGLYSVRELLLILGVEAYGLFNIVFGVAILFLFINGAMVSSTQRYLAYYIGEGNDSLVSDVWNNSIILHFCVGIIISFLLLIVKRHLLDNLLVIEFKFKETADFIYNCSIISVFISVIQAPFNALILAQERMSFFAKVSFIDAGLKLLVIVLLHFFENNILEKYALMYLFSGVIIFFIYYFYCYKYFKKGFYLVKVKTKFLKEMTIYSFWNIFGNFSYMAKTQGINIVLNIFVGVVANSAFAITTNISSAISNLISAIVTAINPQIYKSYAEKDFERNTFLIHKASKFSFYLGLMVVLPVLFNIQYLLELWLRNLPIYLISFVKYALIILLIDCLSSSLMTAIQATGKVKKYQILVSLFVFINLPLSYIGLKLWGNPEVVFIVALFISVVNFWLRLFFVKKLANFDIGFYLSSVIFKVFLVTIASLLSIILMLNIINYKHEIFFLIINSILIVCAVCCNIIVFGLDASERKFILFKINGYLR